MPKRKNSQQAVAGAPETTEEQSAGVAAGGDTGEIADAPVEGEGANPQAADGAATTEAAASGEHAPLSGSIDVPAQTDQSQEILDRLAEVEQPEVPVLDRVLSRLSRSMGERTLATRRRAPRWRCRANWRSSTPSCSTR